MKRLFVSVAVMAALSPSAPVFVGGDGDCHSHGNTPAKAETVSGYAVKCQQALIADDKLDKSWQSIEPDTPKQVNDQGGKEWEVTFKGPAATNKSKANLYIFFTPQGNSTAANLTSNRSVFDRCGASRRCTCWRLSFFHRTPPCWMSLPIGRTATFPSLRSLR